MCHRGPQLVDVTVYISLWSVVNYLYIEFDYIYIYTHTQCKILAMDGTYDDYHLNCVTNYLVRTSQRTLFLRSLKQPVSPTCVQKLVRVVAIIQST